MTKGFQRLGIRMTGVDIKPQPRYCGEEFHQDDAIELLEMIAESVGMGHKIRYSFIHASPPCQAYSDTQRIQDNEHPSLIAPVRELLDRIGLPYVIENVSGAKDELRDPVMLCGAMFGLKTYRHRYFETNWHLTAPWHPYHEAPQVKMGRVPKPGEFIQCVGNFSGVQQGREAMEMPWASREGLREAIPPAYAEWIGRQLLSGPEKKKEIPIQMAFDVLSRAALAPKEGT